MKNKLTHQITLEVALVILVSMLFYTLFQYFFGHVHLWTDLINHLWHTIVLGILIYLVLVWRLRVQVLNSLEQIFQHGYQMSEGIFQHKEYKQAHNEIDNITEIMNRITDHMNIIQGTAWKEYADYIDKQLEQIRDRKDLPMEVYSNLKNIRDDLRKWELLVASFLN